MKKLLVLAVCLFALMGCKSVFNTAPISNIEDQMVTAKITKADMERYINLAGTDMGWTMRKVKDGLIEGTLQKRGHTAVVSIPFTATSYSILYKDSSAGLHAGEGKIHKIYNTWIFNLDKQINKYLVRAANR